MPGSHSSIASTGKTVTRLRTETSFGNRVATRVRRSSFLFEQVGDSHAFLMLLTTPQSSRQVERENRGW